MEARAKLTSNFLYARYVGDKSTEEKCLHGIHNDWVGGLAKWLDFVHQAKNKLKYVVGRSKQSLCKFWSCHLQNSFTEMLAINEAVRDEMNSYDLSLRADEILACYAERIIIKAISFRLI